MARVLVNNLASLIPTNPNYIINGGMDFCQRFNAFGYSCAAVPTNNYVLDRFCYVKTGTMVHTISQYLDAPTVNQSGFAGYYSLLLDCTTAQAVLGAGDYTNIVYRMEGWDFANIKNKRCALSFWVKATKTGIYSVCFKNNASDVCWISEYTVSLSNTWEKKVMFVDFSTATSSWLFDSSIGLKINWIICSGTTGQTSTKDSWVSGGYIASNNQVNGCDSIANNFQLSQVMLVPVNSYVTSYDVPFQRVGKTLNDELLLCQRYYVGQFKWVSSGQGDSTYVQIAHEYDAVLRGIPVLNYYDRAYTLNRVSLLNGASNVWAQNFTPISIPINNEFMHVINTQNAGSSLGYYFNADADLY